MRAAAKKSDFEERYDKYVSDIYRQQFFGEMIKIAEVAEINTIVTADTCTTDYKEPWKSKVEAIKKDLLEYDLTHYPDLLIKDFASEGNGSDLFSFQFRQNEDMVFASPVFVRDRDDYYESRQKFIQAILDQI